MSRSQVYVKVTRGLADLHSELLRYQIDTGSNGNAFLGYLFLSQVEKNKILKLLSFLSVVVSLSPTSLFVIFAKADDHDHGCFVVAEENLA